VPDAGYILFSKIFTVPALRNIDACLNFYIFAFFFIPLPKKVLKYT
jgi:hypothetical protein